MSENNMANGLSTVTNTPPTRLVSFGAALRAAREREGMKIYEFAELADVDKSTISQVETGSAKPSIELYMRLCEMLPALTEAPRPRKMHHSPQLARAANRAARAAKAGTAKPHAAAPQSRYESVLAELKLATVTLKGAQGRVDRLRELVAAEHAKMLAAL